MSPDAPGGRIVQHVRAEAGNAYGLIGGDLHVIEGSGPVYLLRNHLPGDRPPPPLTARDGFPAQPSQLLNARSAVVDFTGRAEEVGELTAWRDSDAGRAVLWLHAPGGHGKTRLANLIGERATAEGWKVLTADHTTGLVDAAEPASQDLRTTNAAGLLLIADYADRWPLAHLTMLFGNKILRAELPVRVLLLARTPHVWPSLRHALIQAGWPGETCVSMRLDPLPLGGEARQRMFAAARDCFASRYRVSASQIPVPRWLDRDEFGLALAVHMAALVAVDRLARTAAAPPVPEDVTGLTAYLLQRERHHWHTLHDSGTNLADGNPAGGRVAFRTPPDDMARVVFTAALTGPVSYRDAVAALASVGLDDTHRMLTDHGYCYPSAEARTVLEPLYPDRLAEDFLALSIPGHDSPVAVPDAWTGGAAGLLLAPRDDDGDLPSYAPRAIGFLVAASDRWPHLVASLEELDALLPEEPKGALAVAAADLAERLASHRLARTSDAAAKADINVALGKRLHEAARAEKAGAAFSEATRLLRPLAGADPGSYQVQLAETLAYFGGSQIMEGGTEVWWTAFLNKIITGSRWTPTHRQHEALAALDESVGIMRELAARDPAEHEGDLAVLLGGTAAALMRLERTEEALEKVDEAVASFRRLASGTDAHAGEHELNLCLWLDLRTMILGELDLHGEALEGAVEAVTVARKLHTAEPLRHQETLRSTLEHLARVHGHLEHEDEALATIEESIAIGREMAGRDPEACRARLLSSLESCEQILIDLGHWERALVVYTEAVRLSRTIAETDPDSHEEHLAGTLNGLTSVLHRLGRLTEAAAAHRESIEIRRRLAEDNPGEHEWILSVELVRFGAVLGELREWDEALTACTEAAEITLRRDQHDSSGAEAVLTTAVTILCDQLADGETWRDPRRPGELAAGFTGELAAVVTGFAESLATPARADDRFPGLADAVESARKDLVRFDPVSGIFRELAGTDPLSYGAATAELRRSGLDAPGTGGTAMTGAAIAELTEVMTSAEPSARDADVLLNAIPRLRACARTDPRRWEPAFAAALRCACLALRHLGRHEEALSPALEATESLARLAEDDPATHRPAFAETWLRAGVIIAELGQPNTSVATTEKAIAFARQRCDYDPGYLASLAAMLLVHARTSARLGRWEEALDAAAESFRLRTDAVVSGGYTAAERFLTDQLGEQARPEQLSALRTAAAARTSPGSATKAPTVPDPAR
ncbi:tetratricopeptide repeat protein [Saccharomonospora sp. NPDC006951]